MKYDIGIFHMNDRNTPVAVITVGTTSKPVAELLLDTMAQHLGFHSQEFNHPWLGNMNLILVEVQE